MSDRMIFREMLSEIKAYAENKANILTKEEINNFFHNAKLDEQQMEHVYAYLESQKIKVLGRGCNALANETGSESEVTLQESLQRKLKEEDMAFYKSYQKDLEHSLQLNTSQLTQAFKAAARNDAMARVRLIEHYLPFVAEYALQYTNRGMLYADLVQEGNIGLLLAAEMLAEEGSTEPEFLVGQIREALEHALLEQQESKHAGEQITERVNHLDQAIKNLELDLERKVKPEELSAYLDMPMEEIMDIIKLAGEDFLDNFDLGEEHHH